MYVSMRRVSAMISLKSFVAAIPVAALAACSMVAHAVIVRGVVRDALGKPVSAARVSLLRGTEVMAFTVSQPDGTYEIRSADRGRFTLYSAAASFSPAMLPSFYGGELTVVTRDITQPLANVEQDITVTATGLPTPVEQSSASVSLIHREELATRAFLLDELRLQPGVMVVQLGQNGGVTSLFVRGGNSDANKVLIDGAPANDVGGVFDYGNLSSTGLATTELHRGPDSVLYGADALAGTVSLQTPRGATHIPVLQYTGDAGNFHTWRNEAEFSGALSRFDYFGAFSRFDSSNALERNRYHASTSAANFGWIPVGATTVRGTVRHAVSANGLPGAHDFGGISSDGKQGDQTTYVTGVAENVFHGNWHNLVRYYGTRKREQSQQFSAVGEAVVTTTPDFSFTTWYGNPVTIRGANGTSGTGRAAIGFNPGATRLDLVSNRDGMQYQSDYRFGQHFSALLGFKYEDERGVYRNPTAFADQSIGRRNYDYNLQLQGDIKARIFYTLGGAIQKNYLFGTEGTPRLGIAGYPVRPGTGWFHGTKLRFNFSKGVQEPSFFPQLQSLYAQLQQAGDTDDIAAFKIRPINAQRSRTYEGGIDQSVRGEKLMLRVTYFHNQFGRQIEFVSPMDITKYFGLPVPVTSFGAYLNSLDFKAQGFETELEWHASKHLFVRGGYTYLDAVVERSFSSDATSVDAGGFPTTNPKYPDTPIGSSSPLVGSRPFRRAPNTGYVVVSYTGSKLSGALKTSMVSRSDDSTFLSFSDINGGNSLLLPNRNLDFGYAKMDANISYQLKPFVSLFTQMNNMLGQQHMGPIGYPALPFNFRTGIKVRLGGR